ncbi:MAG: TlpA disulfide reductase family protein [Saprospiraceae bacterium]|nr:TlpA disulfide reductase family protein [Saprospiraceae bacterium]
MKSILLLAVIFVGIHGLSSQELSYKEALKKCRERNEIPYDPKCVIGLEAPNFIGLTIEKEAMELAQLHGQVVVLYFFYNSCGDPCLKQIPALNEVVKKYRFRDVQFLALADDPENVVFEEFLPTNEFWFKIIPDANEIIWQIFEQPFGLPALFVIDRQGKIAYLKSGGPIVAEAIQENMTELIEAIENCL